jgi:hypothetical protein
MKTQIGGYTYSDKKSEIVATLKPGEVVAYEGGLGWYKYNKKEYETNPRKRLFGF